MKEFRIKNSSPKVINALEYQEYLEYLEEEAMAKQPDDFCFQKPDINSYTESELDIFAFKNQLSDSNVILMNDNILSSYEGFSAAM